MATEYRGLVIKFGGDTSNLTAALKAATKSASETQTQITKMNKALKFDASSLDAAATKFKLIENRAESLKAKLKLTSDNLKQLGSAASAADSNKSIEQLASETNNVALKANLARQNYNELNKQLATLYTPINNAARESGEFAAKWKEITGLKFDAKNWHLHDAFQLDDASFNSVVDSLVKIEAVTTEEVAEIEKMRSAWQGVSNELSDANAVQAFTNTKNEIALAEAELKKYAQMLKEAVPPSEMYSNLETTRQKVSVLDDEVSRLVSTAHSMDDALEVDPSNIDAATTRTKALEQAVELCEKEAKLLEQQIEQLGKQDGVKELADSSKNLTVEFDAATDKVGQLGSALAESKAELAALENNAKIGGVTTELENAREKADKLQTAFDEATKEAQKLGDAKELQNLQAKVVSVTSEATKLSNELDDVADSAKKVDGSFSGISFTELGDTLSSSVTPALERAASAALDMANDFDAAYRDMVKTVDGTESEFESLKQAAIDFSNTHVTSASQMLDIQAIGGELGLAADQIQGFSEAISNITVATNIDDIETAAQDLGSLANIMDDLNENTFTSFSDALVRLGNNGASTESDIMDIAQRIGSMASIVGMSTPEVLALASTVASTGQNAEAAGTAISNTMSDIEGAVAKGGDKLQAFADVANMSADEFKNTWETKPVEAIQAFIQGLKSIEENGGSADATLENLGITGVRQKQALEGLMQTVDGLSDNLTMSGDAWNGVSDQWGKAGDAAIEANKKAEGLSGSLSRISNSAENVAAKFGDAFTPIISGVADLMSGVSTVFSGFDDSMVATIGVIGSVVAVAGPALKILGKVGPLLGIATEGLSLFSAALPIAGVAALVGGITLAIGKFQEWQEEVETTNATFKDAQDIIDENTKSVEGLSDAYAGIEPDVDGALESLKNANDALGDNLSSFSTNSAYLDIYTDTIGELAGKANLSATEQAKLTKAVEGYNEITGATVGIEDIVNGKLDTSTEKIKANAEAWKYNAEMQSYQTAMQDYIQTETDAVIARQIALSNLSDAQKTAADATDKYNEALQKSGGIWNKDVQDAYAEMTAATGKVQEYQEALDNASDAEKQAVKNRETVEQSLEGMQEALEGITQTINEFGDTTSQKMDEFGLSTDTVSAAFARAGISAEELNAIGSENFNQLLATCGGDIDELTYRVQAYNSEGIVDKDGNINVNDVPLVDAQGNLYVYNGTTLVDKDGNIVVKKDELIDAQGRVVKYDQTKLDDKHSDITVTGATDAVSAADSVRRALLNIPTKITSFITTVKNAITGGNAAGGIKHADGGFKVRKHARGAIAHKTTPLDVVGEAGAEAIVPLTNKRYAMPFVKMISQETIAQLEQRSQDIADALMQQQNTERQTSALVNAIKALASSGDEQAAGTTFNYDVKVVRSDADLYSAATIINRAALREAGL